MKAIDTNVLVRFLVKDDEKQATTVFNLFKHAEAENNPLVVPLPVVLETLWVLETVYQIPSKEILAVIEELILMPALKFSNQSTIQHFLSLARETKTDLSDILIAAAAKSAGCKAVLTFDKAAARMDFFELL